MPPIAFIDTVFFLTSGIALLLSLKNRHRSDLSRENRLLLACLLIFTLVYSLCLFIEWSNISTRLDEFEDIVGALLPMWWAIVFYSLVQEVSRRDLQKSEERFRVIFNQTFQFIALIDLDGTVVKVNKSALEITGINEEGFLGKPFWACLWWSHSKELQKKLRDAISKATTGELVRFEASHPDKAGRLLSIDFSLKPVKDDAGDITMLIAEGRDITELKKMEDELLKAQKLESLSILAGGIAHDFNNLLTGILGNLSLAKKYSKAEGNVHEKLTVAEKIIFQAKNLTMQLLTFSKGGALIRKTTSVSELIRESTHFSLRGSNVQCKYTLPEDLWLLDIDEGQLSQVFQNLTLNACQAMPKGGDIIIRAENVLIGEDDNLSLTEGRYMLISFQDHGKGISQKTLSKIFDPYFSTKNQGSGLGLAVVYSIIQKHEGVISVESEWNKGTTFKIYLPASEQSVAVKKEPMEQVRPGSGKILIMDDEEYIREAAEEMLSLLGYEIETASEGKQAIELYQQAMHEEKPFDVVILDLTVPGALGGMETMQKLLEFDHDVKGIVSSGYAHNPVMADFRAYGFVDVVPKPYKIAQMSSAIQKILD